MVPNSFLSIAFHVRQKDVLLQLIEHGAVNPVRFQGMAQKGLKADLDVWFSFALLVERHV